MHVRSAHESYVHYNIARDAEEYPMLWNWDCVINLQVREHLICTIITNNKST